MYSLLYDDYTISFQSTPPLPFHMFDHNSVQSETNVEQCNTNDNKIQRQTKSQQCPPMILSFTSSRQQAVCTHAN